MERAMLVLATTPTILPSLESRFQPNTSLPANFVHLQIVVLVLHYRFEIVTFYRRLLQVISTLLKTRIVCVIVGFYYWPTCTAGMNTSGTKSLVTLID